MNENKLYYYISLLTTTVLSSYLVYECYQSFFKNKKNKKTDKKKHPFRKEKNGDNNVDKKEVYFNKKVNKILITGGPQAGKSNCISYLTEKFNSLGFKVFVAPNIFKITTNSGFIPKYDNINELRIIMKQIFHLEEYFYRIAHNDSDNAILIFNKGTMDLKTFCSDEIWELLLNENGWNEMSLIKRYDVVIHLKTRAYIENDKEIDQSWVFKGNREDSINIDNNTINSWKNHFNLKIILNDKGHNFKMESAFKSISASIGIPTENNFFKKFLLKNKEINFPKNIKPFIIEVEESFIFSSKPNVQIRLVKNSKENQSLYFYKYRLINKKLDQRAELISQIGPKDFMNYWDNKIENSSTIKKLRYSFNYSNVMLVIEKILNYEEEPFYILRYENYLEWDKKFLPPFLEIEKEITNNEEFFTHYFCINNANINN